MTVFVDPVDHSLDVVDGSFLQDAVPEIEDVAGAAFGPRENIVNFLSSAVAGTTTAMDVTYSQGK